MCGLLSAADQTDYARLHSEMFAGVTLSVFSKLIGAGGKLVDAAGKLGGDAALKGAVVTGGTVIANVGGDLAIESRQDASRYNEKSTSVSGGISASGVTVGASRSTVKGDFAKVAEQSGIVAGAGGYHVAVGDGMDL